MKKYLLLLAAIIFLSACGKSQEKILMDQPAADGQFHYSNEELGFALTMPAEFEYYQTQRKNKADFIEVQFFVPTADKEYPQEIQSYAEAAVVRIYEQAKWDQAAAKEYVQDVFPVKKEANGRVYFYKIWPGWPKDWNGKWSKEKDADLLTRFGIINIK